MAAFRAEYGLHGRFAEAVKRWVEAKQHQANVAQSRGSVVTSLVERFQREMKEHLATHQQAERQISRMWRETKHRRGMTKRAAEERRDKAWEAFERASECLEVLGPWYVHADAELNVEYDSLKKALSGIEEGIARLRQLDEDLRADGRVAWYRRVASGRPGIEEPPNADPRAFVAEERRGRDPVVALLIAHEIIRLIPTVENRSSASGGRPGKPGWKRLIRVLSDAGVDDATVQRALRELGYRDVEVSTANIRSARRMAKQPRMPRK